MYIEKLNERVRKEQDEYKSWLLTQPAEVILNNAYEYSIREDIVCAMEFIYDSEILSEEGAEVLINCPNLLEEIYKSYFKNEPSNIDKISEIVDSMASKLLQSENCKMINRNV